MPTGPTDDFSSSRSQAAIVCPQGHKLRSDEVRIVDGNLVCPICRANLPWVSFRPYVESVQHLAGATRYWSRTRLATPVGWIAAALVVFLIGQVSALIGQLMLVSRQHPYNGTAFTVFYLAVAVGTLVEVGGVIGIYRMLKAPDEPRAGGDARPGAP